jgi:hypothetical protein
LGRVFIASAASLRSQPSRKVMLCLGFGGAGGAAGLGAAAGAGLTGRGAGR